EVVIDDAHGPALPRRAPAARDAQREHVRAVRAAGRIPAVAGRDSERPQGVPPEPLAADEEVDLALITLGRHLPWLDPGQRVAALDRRRADVQGVEVGEGELTGRAQVGGPSPQR